MSSASLRARERDDSTGTDRSRSAGCQIRDGSLDINPLRTPPRELAARERRYRSRRTPNRQLRADVASGSARGRANTGVVLSRIRSRRPVGDGELTFREHRSGRRREPHHRQGPVGDRPSSRPMWMSRSMPGHWRCRRSGYYVPRLARHPAGAVARSARAGHDAEDGGRARHGLRGGPRSSGQRTGGFQNDVGRFAGDVDVAALDLAPWLATPRSSRAESRANRAST